MREMKQNLQERKKSVAKVETPRFGAFKLPHPVLPTNENGIIKGEAVMENIQAVHDHYYPPPV